MSQITRPTAERSRESGTLIAIAIAVGLFGCGAVAYYIVRFAQHRLCTGSSSPTLVARFTVAGAVVALLPAGFLSFVVGGTLGGGAASTMLGTFGVPVGIGIAVGICVVFGVVVAVCAVGLGLVGRWVGRLVARFAYGRAAI